ncbi:MAG TPA: alginate export family protein, partial [Planctomycetota bacterium]|nr:alginate export family protein [Planctomycetota bacterium]
MRLRSVAATAATILALTPLAPAQSVDDGPKKIQDLERQVQELREQVEALRSTATQRPSSDELDRAIADLATRIQGKDGAQAKGGANVSAPDVRSIKLTFAERFRAEYYHDRSFGSRAPNSPGITNISPFAPGGLEAFPPGNGHVPDDETRWLNRLRINLDVDVNDKLAAFMQLQQSRAWGSPSATSFGVANGGSMLPNAPVTPFTAPAPPGFAGAGDPADPGTDPDQNTDPAASFKQSYVLLKDMFDTGSNLTLGRFTMELGNGRLVSAADWDNVGRSFDGLRYDYSTSDYRLVAFATKVVQGGLDFAHDDTNFFGAWMEFHPTQEVAVTPYVLYLDDNTRMTAPIGAPLTLGALVSADVESFKLGGEFAIQADSQRPDLANPAVDKSVGFNEAYAYEVHGEFALPTGNEYKPSLGAQYGEGSKYFNDLYSSRQGLYGIADVVTSWSNLRWFKVYGSIAPQDDMELG